MPAYRLSASAEADILAILAYTEEKFGTIARSRYQTLLIAGLRDIAADPNRRGSASRPELGHDVRTYHLRHSKEHSRSIQGAVARPRHLILYRVNRDDLIEVGRVLHDAMEIARHLPQQFGDE